MFLVATLQLQILTVPAAGVTPPSPVSLPNSHQLAGRVAQGWLGVAQGISPLFSLAGGYTPGCKPVRVAHSELQGWTGTGCCFRTVHLKLYLYFSRCSHAAPPSYSGTTLILFYSDRY